MKRSSGQASPDCWVKRTKVSVENCKSIHDKVYKTKSSSTCVLLQLLFIVLKLESSQSNSCQPTVTVLSGDDTETLL